MLKPSDDTLSLVTATLLDQLARVIQTMCFTDQLPPVQWSALRYFARAGINARNIAGLSSSTGVTHSSASRTVAALAKKGFLAVQPDRNDRRARRVEVTPQGWRILGNDPLRFLAKNIALLTDTDKLVLYGTLETLLNSIREAPLPGRRSTGN